MIMENTIIEYLKVREPELLDKITSTFAEYKKLDFMSIRQSDIIVLTPEQAYEYKGNEGDKYFKIWMAGDTIAFCTWSNSMIDSHFRWNSKDNDPDKKRDNADIIGNEPHISAFIKSKSAINKCTLVYMFPFASFSSSYSKKHLHHKIQEGLSAVLDTSEEDAEEKKRKKLLSQKKESIAAITFDRENIKQTEDQLKNLAIAISSNIDDPNAENFIKVAQLKFNEGLTCLKIASPDNPMITYFEQQQQQWEKTKKRNRMEIIGIFALLITISLIMYFLDKS